MASVQTFGVDADRIKASLPQIVIDSGTGILLTTTRATTIINNAAARVCALIEAAFGAGTAAEIAADTTTIQYANCQRLVVCASIPDILRASHHPPMVDAEIRELLADYNAQLELAISDPARAIGRVDDDTSVSATSTRFAALSLSTTTSAQRKRRMFDGRNDALGVDEGGFQW